MFQSFFDISISTYNCHLYLLLNFSPTDCQFKDLVWAYALILQGQGLKQNDFINHQNLSEPSITWTGWKNKQWSDMHDLFFSATCVNPSECIASFNRFTSLVISCRQQMTMSSQHSQTTTCLGKHCNQFKITNDHILLMLSCIKLWRQAFTRLLRAGPNRNNLERLINHCLFVLQTHVHLHICSISKKPV